MRSDSASDYNPYQPPKSTSPGHKIDSSLVKWIIITWCGNVSVIVSSFIAAVYGIPFIVISALLTVLTAFACFYMMHKANPKHLLACGIAPSIAFFAFIFAVFIFLASLSAHNRLQQLQINRQDQSSFLSPNPPFNSDAASTS